MTMCAPMRNNDERDFARWNRDDDTDADDGVSENVVCDNYDGRDCILDRNRRAFLPFSLSERSATDPHLQILSIEDCLHRHDRRIGNHAQTEMPTCKQIQRRFPKRRRHYSQTMARPRFVASYWHQSLFAMLLLLLDFSCSSMAKLSKDPKRYFERHANPRGRSLGSTADYSWASSETKLSRDLTDHKRVLEPVAEFSYKSAIPENSGTLAEGMMIAFVMLYYLY